MKKAAELLKQHRGEIMTRWKENVRKKVKGADQSSDLVLLDHLPDLMDDLINILDSSQSVEEMTQENDSHLFKMSIEHGRHRSSSYGYTIDKIIHEFIIFHHVLTDLLIAHNAFSTEAGLKIKYAVESSMMFSSSAFNESLNEMRQKMVRVLAHDLRNPISAALLGVELIDKNDQPERLDKIKDLTKSSLKRAMDLIENLLETVAIEAGEGMTINFSSLNLMHYIHSLHYEASEIYPNKISLEVQGNNTIHGVFDGAMIRRVLENFLSNALKHGERNGPVRIIVNNREETVAIKVHNQGNPIPVQKREEIFHYLKTSGTKSLDGLKSWGIGLALVKAVVDAHGGSLNVESSKKEGTSFEIVLDKHKNKPGKIKTEINFR